MENLFFGETRHLTPIDYDDMVGDLATFCKAVRDAMPYYNLKFYGKLITPHRNLPQIGLSAFNSMQEYVCEVQYERCYVALDGEPLILGGMCVAEKHDNNMLYTVYSDNIENNKYGRGKGARSASSKKLDVAIRNARKYLRKRSEADTAKILSDWCREIVRTEQQVAKLKAEALLADNLFGGTMSTRYNTLDKLVQSPVMQELLRLCISGAIQDQKVLKPIMEIQAKMKEIEQLDPAKPGWHIVFMQKNRVGQNRVVMAKMMVVGNPQSWSKTFDVEGDAYVMEPREVPEIVQGRISVLQMLEDGKHVDGVGVKLSNECFYINLEEPAGDHAA